MKSLFGLAALAVLIPSGAASAQSTQVYESTGCPHPEYVPTGSSYRRDLDPDMTGVPDYLLTTPDEFYKVATSRPQPFGTPRDVDNPAQFHRNFSFGVGSLRSGQYANAKFYFGQAINTRKFVSGENPDGTFSFNYSLHLAELGYKAARAGERVLDHMYPKPEALQAASECVNVHLGSGLLRIFD